MDLASTIVPRSDQLNAEDLLAGPVTVTVESVTAGSAEQPVNVRLVEFPGRPYRPSKTMRRVLVKLWGREGDVYAGRRMTLYRDPDVKFGGIKVGGIKISHLSHIERPATLVLTETKGHRVPHEIKPLPADAPASRTRAARTPAPAPEATPRKPSGEQMVALGLAFTAAGITDGAGKARYVAETLGRELHGWDDLTAADVETLTDALKAVTAPAAAGFDDDAWLGGEPA